MQQKTSGKVWLQLIAIGATVATMFALALATVSVAAVLAVAQIHAPRRPANPPQAQPQPSVPARPSGQSFSGVISDSVCGAKHNKNINQSAAGCTRYCVRGGAHYTLVNGDRIYNLRGHEGYLDRYAGQRVTIIGSLQGDTLNVASVGQ
jgi:uncharacterized membrane protein